MADNVIDISEWTGETPEYKKYRNKRFVEHVSSLGVSLDRVVVDFQFGSLTLQDIDKFYEIGQHADGITDGISDLWYFLEVPNGHKDKDGIHNWRLVVSLKKELVEEFKSKYPMDKINYDGRTR